jgi:hypothetical protein
MILLNFSHPLTPAQIAQAAALAGQPIETVVDLPVHFDGGQPFVAQLHTLAARIPLDAATLQTAPILVNLPSLNFIAGLLLAELHGRIGYFPTILRLRRVDDSLPPRFEVAELLNLQEARDQARQAR